MPLQCNFSWKSFRLDLGVYTYIEYLRLRLSSKEVLDINPPPIIYICK